MKRIAGFDGIRGLAVLLVLLSHTHVLAALNNAGLVADSVVPMLRGTTGVVAFFILSGFLITFLLIREQQEQGGVSIRNFWARRALRIFPVYFLCLIPLALASLHWNTGIDRESFLYAFTYLYNFIPKAHYSTTLGHTWSLAVEEHFYLIWPFVFVALFARAPKLLALLLALAIAASHAAQIVLLAQPELTETYFVGRWSFLAGWHIGLGCLLALLLRAGSPRWQRLLGSRAALLLGLALFASSLLPEAPDRYLRPYGMGLCVAWVYLNQSSLLTRVLEFRPLAYLGTISYGVYMYQGIFLGTGPYRAPDVVWPPPQPLGLAMLCIVAPLSFHFLEKPILALKERYFRKPPAPSDSRQPQAAE